MITHRPAAATPVPTMKDGVRLSARLLKLLRPHWRRMSKGLGMSLVIGIVGLVPPLLSKLFFDDVYPANDFGFLHTLVIAVLVIAIVTAIMNSVRGYFAQVLGARIATDLGLLFFNHLQHLEAQFFDDHRVGEIMSRTGDLNRSISFVTGLFQTVFVNGMYLILVPPVLFLLNWRLALLALATTPITTTLALVTGRTLRKLSKKSMELNAECGAYSMEVLSNIRVIKAAAAEQDTYARMRESVIRAQHAQLKSGAVGVVLGVLNAAIRAAGAAAFSWVAWTEILQHQLSLGSFIAFSAYLGYLTGPVGQFAGLFTGFQDAAVSLGRFFEYYDLPTEQHPSVSIRPRSPVTHHVRGVVEFDNVTFGYSADSPVLKSVSLRIGPGEVSAFVGASGAGKSSLIKLLLRLYSPSAGSVLIDGIPVSRFPLTELRSQIATVWQDNGVLSGTLRENLTLGASDVAEDAIADAVRSARLDNFVRTLPDGLDSMIGEWGSTLSGGQRQRLAIARALVRRSPILVMDEATSHLDASTEEDFLRGILPRCTNVTVLFVTHRLFSASLADRIFVVDSCSVTGGLPHSEMLATHDVYRSLWASATGSNIAAVHYQPSARADRVAANQLRRL